MPGERLTSHYSPGGFIYHLFFYLMPGRRDVQCHISPVGSAIEPRIRAKGTFERTLLPRLPLPTRSYLPLAPSLAPVTFHDQNSCQGAGCSPHVLAKAPPFFPAPSCCCQGCGVLLSPQLSCKFPGLDVIFLLCPMGPSASEHNMCPSPRGSSLKPSS